jgi:hypothetical protein
VVSGDLTPSSGTGTSATFTGHAIGSAIIHVISGSLTGTDSGTITVTPGSADATQSTLTPTSASITANGANIQALTVHAKDTSGNNLTSGGASVTITKLSGTGNIGAVTDNGNGTYSATVTAPNTTGSGVFVATLDTQPVKSSTANQTRATITYTSTGSSGGGGGGGITGPITVSGVTDVTGIVDSKGVFSQITNAWSDDKKVVLNIPVNTTGLTASGAPLTQLSIIQLTTPPTFTAGAGMVSLPYDCTPSGVTFNPPATIRFSYDPALIPAGVAETSLQIAYYDSTVNSWITLPSTFDTDSHFIYAQITHFTVYAVTYGVKAVTPIPTTTTPTTTEVVTTTTPPSSTTTSLPPKTTTTSSPQVTTTPVITQHPSTFEASSLLINPSTVKPDENVDIHLKITNTGDVTGTDTVVLRVNNVIVDSKDITLDGGTSTTITFITSSKLPGNYTIESSGLKGEFTVSKSATVEWFWLIAIGAFLGGTTLAVSFVMLSKRKA